MIDRNSLQTLTQTDLAWIFGVSRTTLIRWAKQDLPRGRNKRYDLSAAIGWYKQRLDDSSDGAIALSDDQEGRRYRRAKASLAELDLEERRGGLVDRAENRKWLGEIAAFMRNALEKIQREWPDAYRILDSAMDTFDRRIEKETDDD